MKKNKIFIGLNLYHPDTSLVALNEEKILLAIEEERLNRIKHFSGFPKLSLDLLKKKFIKKNDELFFYLNTNPRSSFFRKSIHLIKNFNFEKVKDIKRNLNKINTKNKLEEIFDRNVHLKFVDHHLCHVLPSMYSSKYNESLMISVDAFGDFKSCEVYYLCKDEIKLIDSVYFPNSLGVFYSALTQFCGFNDYGDEYKLMGLSAHGKHEVKYEKLNDLISFSNKKLFTLNLKYFSHVKNSIEYEWNNKQPKVGTLFNKNELEDLLKIKSNNKKNYTNYSGIAFMTQLIYENTLFSLLKKYQHISKNLILSGGCALNCLANGKIKEKTKFENIHINFAPGDNGGALGAALYGHSKYFSSRKTKKIYNINSPYLGTKYSNEEISSIIKIFDKKIKWKKLSKKELIKFISLNLSKNKIIAYFRGKMEFGPRALGTRSILASPIKERNKDLLNLKIKKRESFRPFAPIVHANKQNNYFTNSWSSPFMSFVFKSRANVKIPSALNIDKSGRVQSLNKKSNKDTYEIIQKFGNLTSVYALINTSFNKHEPIIENPSNAIKTFLETDIDYLILENYVIEKNKLL
tara:strand:+ start:2959 stop:4689 length:1731 start_codon:yes stop_codon:yes gene_type:complete